MVRLGWPVFSLPLSWSTDTRLRFPLVCSTLVCSTRVFFALVYSMLASSDGARFAPPRPLRHMPDMARRLLRSGAPLPHAPTPCVVEYYAAAAPPNHPPAPTPPSPLVGEYYAAAAPASEALPTPSLRQLLIYNYI